MKTVVTIAGICVILFVVFFFTCVYQLGKSLYESTDVADILRTPTSNYDPTTFSCSESVDTLIDRVSLDTTFLNSVTIIADSNTACPIKIQIKKLNQQHIAIELNSDDLLCFSEGDDIHLIFTDGTTVKFDNYLDFNCDRLSAIYLGNYKKSKQLAQIKSKRIQAIRTSNGIDICEADFTENSRQHFQAVLNCF